MKELEELQEWIEYLLAYTDIKEDLLYLGKEKINSLLKAREVEAFEAGLKYGRNIGKAQWIKYKDFIKYQSELKYLK